MTEVSSISEDEWDVWRAFHAMRSQLDLVLDRRLQQDAGISAQDYGILLTLFEAPGNQLRARELGDLLGWEKSRLSHQVTRMESRGLVKRSTCDSDARGTWIEITAEGRRTLLGAMRDHALTIRRLFFDVLSDADQSMLKAVSARVLERIDPPICDDVDSLGVNGDPVGRDERSAGAA